MAIVKQKDSRSGIVYVYESISWYDKEKKQSRCKRRLIGRWDEKNEMVIPTDGRGKRDKKETVKLSPKKGNGIISEGEYELLYKQAVKDIRRLERLLQEQKNIISELEKQIKG